VRKNRGDLVHQRVVHVQIDQPLARGGGLDEGNTPLGDRWMPDDADQAQLAHGLFGFFDPELAEPLLNQGQADGENAGEVGAGAGDDLVLMADIDDAPGDGAAHRGGHGDGGVDVGLGKAGQAHGGILSDRGHAVDGAADVVVAVYIGSHFKAP